MRQTHIIYSKATMVLFSKVQSTSQVTQLHYFFEVKFGCFISANSICLVMNEYELRNIVPEVFDIGTNIRIFLSKVTQEFIK